MKDLLLVVDMQNVYGKGMVWECSNMERTKGNIHALLSSGMDAAFTLFDPPSDPVGAWNEYCRVNKDVNEDSYAGAMMDEFMAYADDFPVPVDFTAQRTIKIKQGDLARIIDRISYAVSLDDSRKVLQGIFFSIKEGNLTAVATDGKRLALVEKLLDEAPVGSDGDIIVTLKAANEIKRILEKDGDVVIEIGEKQAVFKVDSTMIYSKLIDGNYPNYKQVIPASFAKKISVPCSDFIDALEIVSIPLFDASSSYVKITFTTNKLMFEANSNIGEGKEHIAIEYEGEEMSLSFNPQFLSDPFKHIGVDNVNIKINDAFSPIAIESGDGFLYVIMPMRNK